MNRLLICLYIMLSFIVSAEAQTKADSTKPSGDSSGTGESVFERVEIEAAFEGGENAWRSFLQKNLNPNVPVDNGAPAGKFTVMVQFVVDREGNISDIKALTKHGYGMEQEVLRILKTGPKWSPAIQKGRTVKAYRKQPVTFMIEDENFSIDSKEPFVFYLGIENPITITSDKAKPNDLHVTISQGSIVSQGNGRFVVKPIRAGRAVLEIYNAKKGNKKIGAASFEVKAL